MRCVLSSLVPLPHAQEYDFVTDVFVTDERSVKLGFNKDDDPEKVRHYFSFSFFSFVPLSNSGFMERQCLSGV